MPYFSRNYCHPVLEHLVPFPLLHDLLRERVYSDNVFHSTTGLLFRVSAGITFTPILYRQKSAHSFIYKEIQIFCLQTFILPSLAIFSLIVNSMSIQDSALRKKVVIPYLGWNGIRHTPCTHFLLHQLNCRFLGTLRNKDRLEIMNSPELE